MKNHISILKATRANVLKAVAGLTKQQLNYIPKGFNNNLIWNLGHLLVTQQILCYLKSGATCRVEEALINKYKKGTKPEVVITIDEITYIKTALTDLVERLEEDWEQGVFTNYDPYSTSYGVVLNTIEEAIIFNNVHEGLHYGTILALKKLV